MQNLNKKLKQAADAWAVSKNYSRKAMPEVLALNVDKIYKPHIFACGTDKEQYGLMKPRGRTHGYALYQFDNAFCKLV